MEDVTSLLNDYIYLNKIGDTMDIDLKDKVKDKTTENTETEYNDLVKDIRFNSNLFIQLSEEAANGTKTLALECRKMSLELNKHLMKFRKLSIQNDKLK